MRAKKALEKALNPSAGSRRVASREWGAIADHEEQRMYATLRRSPRLAARRAAILAVRRVRVIIECCGVDRCSAGGV